MLSIGAFGGPVLVVILSSGENDINWAPAIELTLDMRSSCPPVVAPRQANYINYFNQR